MCKSSVHDTIFGSAARAELRFARTAANMMGPEKSKIRADARLVIVSGGQTGADQAALRWALARGLPYGGWCPKGRRAENGVIPARFSNLVESDAPSYSSRTRANARDSDGTVIFTLASRLAGGCRLTCDCARAQRKPVLHLHAGVQQPARVLAWFIRKHRIKRLNVAGSRASREPEVSAFTCRTLDDAWQILSRAWAQAAPQRRLPRG